MNINTLKTKQAVVGFVFFCKNILHFCLHTPCGIAGTENREQKQKLKVSANGLV